MSTWTTRRTVRGDGVDLAVFEANTEAEVTVVLVHGYPDTHQVWDAVAGTLAEQFHVVAHDVRGAGASGVPDSVAGYRLEHLVADISAVLDATSPDRPAHLVGHDWGSIQSWEAVTGGRLDGRIASFTSMSGPGLDHVGAWMRTRVRTRWWRTLIRQGLHSWYVAFFQTPRLPEAAWDTVAARGFPRYLQRVERVPADRLPGPTLAADGRNGVNLYRANAGRVRRPDPRSTPVPVQLVVADRDRFVTPALLADTGDHAPDLTVHHIDGGHWDLVRHPARFAGLVRAFVTKVES